jgi:ankyrin repeat protein
LHLMAHRFAWRDFAKLLIARHAPLNVADDEGFTALLRALQGKEDNRGVAIMLIEANADIEKADKDGNTPLMVAAMNGNVELVGRLLEKGAKIETRNKAGKTAEEIALEKIDAPGMTGALRQDVVATIRQHAESRQRKAEAERKAAVHERQSFLRQKAPRLRIGHG